MAQRLESVRLELSDAGFSSGMVKAAAATGLLERALKGLDGTTVRIDERITTSSSSIDRISSSARDADGSINQLTGRLRVLGEVAAILGPSLTPLGGVAIAGVGGLANQLGLAAVAGGVLIGSMQGVGDALSAMNKAQLDPTVANLEKAEDALRALSPAARDFANEAFALKPALVALRDLGAESLFPGLTESLDSLERLGPQVGSIMQAVAGALGEIASDSAASLASERWEGFFRFIEEEAPRTISELATTVGDLTHGLAGLWMAFEPLNSDFSSWLMDVAAGFDEWATGLSATDGFTEFVSYIRETGPQVAETLGAMFDAVVQFVQATAPLGGPVLAGIEAVSNAIAAIADSDLGTPILAGVAALSLLNRTLAVTASLSKASLSSGLFSGVGTLQKGIKGQSQSIRADLKDATDGMVAFGANAEKAAAAADRLKGRLATGAGLAGMGVLATGAADGIGLTNTASLALMGTIAGPWGAAIGGGVGLLMDLKAGHDNATASADAFAESLKTMTSAQLLQMEASEKQRLIDEGYGADNANLKAIQEQIEATTLLEATERSRTRAAAISYASQVGLNTDLAKWQRKSVEEIKAQADALAALTKEADETSASFLKFPDSLNKAKVSLGDFLGEMEKNARALANFNSNSLKAARNGLDEGLIASLRKMGTEGALRMQQFANASEDQIARANKAHNSYQRETERSRRVTAQLAGMSPVELKVNAQTSPAMRNIEALEARLRAIKDEDVFVNVRQIGSTTLGPRNENALGDFKNAHSPQIAPGGAMRVWAEPETGGESYIPHANDHRRPRAKSILEQTATMFGGSVQWFAEGGTTGHKGDKRKFEGAFTEAFTPGFAAWASTQHATVQAMLAAAGDQAAAARNQLQAAEASAEAAQEQKEAAESQLDAVKQQRDAFADQIRGNFENNPFGSGFNAAVRSLTKDAEGATEFEDVLRRLEGLGLDGSAYGALAASGDTATARGILNRGEEGVGMFEGAYGNRENALGSLSNYAADEQYAEAIALHTAEVTAATAVADQMASNVQGLTGSVWALEQRFAGFQSRIAELSEALKNRSDRPIVVNESFNGRETAREIARLERAGAR